MKVLILGSKGMLGRDLVAACATAGISATAWDVDQLDITQYQEVFKKIPIVDWIVNCAAYTRVDDAEKHRDAASAVNTEGARNVARVAVKKRVKMAYVSTDYVFDGTATRPYVEQDQTNPINAYGASKLAGEKAIRSEGGHYLIVRTQSLFGPHGRNFVKAIAAKLKSGDEPLRVVDDQRSSPTYTAHLAGGMLRLLRANASGIVHLTASWDCTWFEFAQAIAKRLKPSARIVPATSSEMSFPAQRPAYSVLDNRKYRTLTGHVMPTWEQGLDEYLKVESF